jgi:hypothetical protein
MQQAKWKPLRSPRVQRDQWRVFTAVIERCGNVLRTARLRKSRAYSVC